MRALRELSVAVTRCIFLPDHTYLRVKYLRLCLRDIARGELYAKFVESSYLDGESDLT